MKYENEPISAFNKAMRSIRKIFLENPVNKTILLYLYGLSHGSVGKIENIWQAAIREYSIPPYDNPKIFLSEIFGKSMARLEKNGLIGKTFEGGYRITPLGVNCVQLFWRIEAFMEFNRKLSVEQLFLEK